MFRPRDLRIRARIFAEHVLAASDVALGGDGRFGARRPTQSAFDVAPAHPHRRAAAVPARARRSGRVVPGPAQCLSPVGHRSAPRRPAPAPRGH